VLFFSRRRRHTIFSRDWSSDVCSSDLVAITTASTSFRSKTRRKSFTVSGRRRSRFSQTSTPLAKQDSSTSAMATHSISGKPRKRSEERRVGKEGKERGEAYHEKQRERD